MWDVNWGSYVDGLMVHSTQTGEESQDNVNIHHQLVPDDLAFYEEENAVYMVANIISTTVLYSLIDRGANGGVAGEDMRPIKFDRDHPRRDGY